MQAGNELIGREIACSCLGAAAQFYEAWWGSLIHLLSSPGEVWQALSYLLAYLSQSNIRTMGAIGFGYSNERQETAFFPCPQSCRDLGASSSFPNTHCQTTGHNERTLS